MKQGLKDFLKGCLYAAFMLALVGLFKYGNGYFDNKTIHTFHYDSYRTNPLPKDTLGIGESKCLPVKQDIASPTFQLIRIETSVADKNNVEK
jgi:tRNA A37 threonylcarbamoyladenosine biosynthesis protein TsaE